MAKKIQVYEGEKVTVRFDANRCMHAGQCVQNLPDVFKPNDRPWVYPDAADAEAIATVVEACPSGALTYEKGGVEHAGDKPAENSVTVMPNGPLYLHAEMTINGEEQPTCRAALCRCGATKRTPYCDGAHKQISFKDRANDIHGDVGDSVVTSARLEVVGIQDGPLMVRGGCEVRNIKGEVVAKGQELFFCRCGASGNKPFCDGSHNKVNFRSK